MEIRNALSKLRICSFKLAIVTENGSKQKKRTNIQILWFMWSWRWDSFPSSMPKLQGPPEGFDWLSHLWWWIVFVVWLTDERCLASFQLGPLPKILTIANLWHTESRVWSCAEPEFRLSWIKLCSNDSHHTTAPFHYPYWKY